MDSFDKENTETQFEERSPSIPGKFFTYFRPVEVRKGFGGTSSLPQGTSFSPATKIRYLVSDIDRLEAGNRGFSPPRSRKVGSLPKVARRASRVSRGGEAPEAPYVSALPAEGGGKTIGADWATRVISTPPSFEGPGRAGAPPGPGAYDPRRSSVSRGPIFSGLAGSRFHRSALFTRCDWSTASQRFDLPREDVAQAAEAQRLRERLRRVHTDHLRLHYHKSLVKVEVPPPREKFAYPGPGHYGVSDGFEGRKIPIRSSFVSKTLRMPPLANPTEFAYHPEPLPQKISFKHLTKKQWN